MRMDVPCHIHSCQSMGNCEEAHGVSFAMPLHVSSPPPHLYKVFLFDSIPKKSHLSFSPASHFALSEKKKVL